MTNHPNADAENPREQDEDSSSESATPPPPPEETQDDDVRRHRMLFSGHQREQLTTLRTTKPSRPVRPDDDELYRCRTLRGGYDTAHTELNVPRISQMHTTPPSNCREKRTSRRRQISSLRELTRLSHCPAATPQTAGTTNEPLALAMFIILTLAALGLFGALLWLIYRLVTGA